jgi:hypothetical protein
MLNILVSIHASFGCGGNNLKRRRTKTEKKNKNKVPHCKIELNTFIY